MKSFASAAPFSTDLVRRRRGRALRHLPVEDNLGEIARTGPGVENQRHAVLRRSRVHAHLVEQVRGDADVRGVLTDVIDVEEVHHLLRES